MGVTNKNKYCPICNKRLILDEKEYDDYGNIIYKSYICCDIGCKLLGLIQEFKPKKRWIAYGEIYKILASGDGVYGNV